MGIARKEVDCRALVEVVLPDKHLPSDQRWISRSRRNCRVPAVLPAALFPASPNSPRQQMVTTAGRRPTAMAPTPRATTTTATNPPALLPAGEHMAAVGKPSPTPKSLRPSDPSPRATFPPATVFASLANAGPQQLLNPVSYTYYCYNRYITALSAEFNVHNEERLNHFSTQFLGRHRLLRCSETVVLCS